MKHAHVVAGENTRSAVALEFLAPALRCASAGQFARMELSVAQGAGKQISVCSECVAWEIRALRGDRAAMPRVACSSPGTPPLRSRPSISERSWSMSSTAGLPDSTLSVSIANGLSSSRWLDLFELVQRNAASTAFQLTQVGATRVTEVTLGDVSLTTKRPEYGWRTTTSMT